MLTAEFAGDPAARTLFRDTFSKPFHARFRVPKTLPKYVFSMLRSRRNYNWFDIQGSIDLYDRSTYFTRSSSWRCRSTVRAVARMGVVAIKKA